MKKKTKVILTGISAAAACGVAAGAASWLITKRLVGLAIDKDAPLRMNNQASKMLTGNLELSQAVDDIFDAAHQLADSEHTLVTTESHDGLTLVGHWFPCENAKRTIIAMHGWRSTWSSDFGLIAPFWRNRGCNVLYAEQRAQGNSEGDYMGFGMLERYDCLNWIHWVNDKVRVQLPVYLGGVSMGATTVLMTTAFVLPENVRGIIADCGFTSAQDIWKHVVQKNMHLSYNGLRSTIADNLCRGRIGIGPNHCDTIEAMRSCKIPVLFIHGTDDHFVPIKMTFENYKACTAPKQLLVVPGAEHGMSYYVDKDSYESIVSAFWNTYDN